jgi:hypothetical protein
LRTVILPKDNEKDLADIPPEIKAQMSIHFVESMDEVLQIALEHPLPIPGHHHRLQEVEPEVRRGRRAGQRTNQLKPSVLPYPATAGPARSSTFSVASPFQLAARHDIAFQ